MDDYLLNLTMTVSKTGLKMLCHIVFVSFFHCITKMISVHCLMSENLSNEIYWFLSSLSCSQLYLPDHKNQFVTNLLSKNMHEQKCSKKSNDSEYKISKAKNKLLTTVASVSFISSKICHSYFKWRNCQKFWPCFRNFNSSLIHKNIDYWHIWNSHIIYAVTEPAHSNSFSFC